MRTEGGLLAPVAEPQRDGWWWRVWRAGAISVLIVGDDTAWQGEIAALLEAEGYAVRIDDGSGDLADPSCPFDIAVVDLGLTARSPRAVCTALRAWSIVPILAVAPCSGREPVVLEAYAAGADQCVSPTVRSRELLARVRALLRRHPPLPRRIIDLADEGEGAISLDPSTCTAVIAGQSVSLTTQESAILYALLWRPGRCRDPGGADEPGCPWMPGRRPGRLVRQVRTKLEAVEGKRRIVAVRGVGFRFLPTDEVASREGAEHAREPDHRWADVGRSVGGRGLPRRRQRREEHRARVHPSAARPLHVAERVLWLISPEARPVTGSSRR